MLKRTLGSYRLVRKIGQGGMGAVYEAVHAVLGTRAAVKVLLRHALLDPQAAARFFNEAKAISMVSHPCLVKIYEYGEAENPDGSPGEPYIVMEYLEGESLRARLTRRYLGGSAIGLMTQLASALTATHKKRIVHRDLKPDNIMLVLDDGVTGGERVKILDFGIAKLLPEEGGDDAASAAEPARFVKTRTGSPIGTPAYMSPEQCRASAPVDDRTDVYSLGIIFYEMLYGDPPFNSNSAGELYALQLFAPPPALQQRVPAISQKLAELVHRMLDKKPAERPSMEALLAELRSLPDSGLRDGPAEIRPSETAAAGLRAKDEPQDSGIIRRQLDQNVQQQETAPLRTAPDQSHTGADSRGERVARLPSLSQGRVLLVVGCTLFGFILLALGIGARSHSAAKLQPAPLASPAAAVQVPTPQPPPTPPAVPAQHAEAKAAPQPGREIAAAPPVKEKAMRKTGHAAKKDNIKIELWK